MATRTLTIAFTGDTKGLEQASQRGKQQVDGWKGTFATWNRRAVLASTIIVGAAVKVGKSLIDAGREGIKQEAALAQVFESLGGTASAAFQQAGDEAMRMSRLIGVPGTEITAVQTKLATFPRVWEDPIKGAENFNRATMLAFDLEAAGFGDAEGNITQLGKALNDPIQGMSALTRVGVSFTEAEKEKIKQLAESGDLLGAQEILYQALESQVGGVAEATTDGGDRMRAMWENLQDQLGRQLIPAFERLMEIGQRVLEWASENSATLLKLGAVVVGLAGFVLVANAVWKVYVAITKAARLAVIAFAAAQRVLNLVMRANPIGIIITLLAALVAGIIYAYRNSETFRRIVDAAMRGIRTAFGWVIDRGKQLVSFFSSAVSRIRSIFSTVGQAISAPFRAAFNAVRSLWNSTVGKISFTIPSWVPGVGGKGFSFPKMHSGGVFMPPSGQSEGLALLRRGERVLTPGEDRRRGGDTYNVTVQAWSDRFSLRQVMDELRFQGAV
jgi:hypothetical protein